MSKKRWLLIPLVILLILVIVYCYQAIHFQDKFLNKTMIGKTDVSGLTTKEAIAKLEKTADDQVFHVMLDGKEWKSIPKAELGMEYNVEETVNKVMANHNSWAWFMPYFKAPENVAIATKGADEKAVEKKLVELKKDVDALNKDRTPSANASVGLKDGKFQIIPEVQGNTIDTKELVAAAKASMTGGEPNIELTKYVTKPTILATDGTIEKEMDRINKIADINASYSINGQNIVIPKEKIATWVTFDDGELGLKYDAVREYVAELGATYNTSTNPSKFNSTKRGEVSVPAGALSWTIATDTETEQLIAAILAGEDFTGRVPAFQGSGTPGSPLIGNSYIEVDLVNQHMWYYKDGVVALETPVITGKPKTPTPPGVFYVWNKERDAILKGEDYASPVDYWMPIDWTGVGIHDSPWQAEGSYGGDSHLTVGSHGCINTPPSVMKKLFNMIDVGVPVVVF